MQIPTTLILKVENCELHNVSVYPLIYNYISNIQYVHLGSTN